MQSFKHFLLLPTGCSLSSFRCYRSAYRLKPGSLNSIKLNKNKTDEEKYKEEVQDAMLHKHRTPFRGYERPHLHLKFKHAKLPNASFYGQDDLPTYRSYKNYVKEAERARRKYRERWPFWKTLDYWWTYYRDEPKYVNIGLPFPHTKLSGKEKKMRYQQIRELKKNPDMERQARKRTLKIDVEKFLEEREASVAGAVDVCNVAKQFKIYLDLFGNGFFYPLVPMTINYENDEFDIPVYWGNEVSVSESIKPPMVSFASEPDDLWSLVLTSPDANLERNTMEYLHWFVANIKGGDVSSGETIMDYLRPIPCRGTGFQRMVFILFKQNKEIDFSEEKKELPCLSLRERDFLIRKLHKKYKDDLTPVSLRFFQTKWEESTQDFFHNTLDIPEPVYEFTPWKVDKVGRLKQFPQGKTLDWLKRFMPRDPVYPGGGKFT